MRGLHGLAWRGLRARPLRTTLTTIGVALGVAVLYAGLATNAGDRRGGRAGGRWRWSGERTCASPRSARPGCRTRPSASIEQTPGVAVAAPSFERTDVSRDRRVRARTAAGAGHARRHRPGAGAADPRSVPGRRRGADVRRRAAALVSATLAREDGLTVGSRLGLQGIDSPVYLRVAGDPRRRRAVGGPDGPGRRDHLPIARSVFGADGADARRPRRSPREPTPKRSSTRSRRGSPASRTSSRRRSDLAASMQASTGEFAATTALIAAVALFAGAFLIFNTLSMTVVERVRELGLLRAAGATRRPAHDVHPRPGVASSA